MFKSTLRSHFENNYTAHLCHCDQANHEKLISQAGPEKKVQKAECERRN